MPERKRFFSIDPFPNKDLTYWHIRDLSLQFGSLALLKEAIILLAWTLSKTDLL